MTSESASLKARCCNRRTPSLGLLLVLPLTLAACSAGAPPTFDLSPASGSFHVHAARGQLAVAEPVTDSPLASQRILVRRPDDSIAYLSGAQWADRLPALVQTRLIETFENAHLLREVGRPGMAANFTLSSEIRRFELNAANFQTAVVIAAQLVDNTGRIRYARIFKASVPTQHDDGPSVSAALDQALGQVMRQIVRWAAPLI
ncbi:ABC-type transport auxiliary lipoprotein family protein [Beijerinckia mobilis]|uniref:ABC-type transport auxiliary lipoprotein family protein n=1 Tax=Beijerinckia mobilis TaxID=231434 RepID=UPI000552CCF0|nr:ABC-type transport auxiliary lipoprotein family protein [Beijerinckia mobilis]